MANCVYFLLDKNCPNIHIIVCRIVCWVVKILERIIVTVERITVFISNMI